MNILIFTEGCILMHQAGKDVSREERVKKSQQAGIQREERNLAYSSGTSLPKESAGSVYDFTSYIPIDNAVKKIALWKNQGANISYLTSRRIKDDIDAVRNVLQTYDFPSAQNLFFRQQGEDYVDVIKRLMPDIVVEDDCESIGGAEQMISTHVDESLKETIKFITVKEFGGIDHLPDTL